MQKMATAVSNSIRDLCNSAAEAVESSVHNRKIADLEKNTKNQNDPKQNTTTDWGAKVADVDHALKILDEEGNHVGPTLLEDEVFRERVSCPWEDFLVQLYLRPPRSTGSTTSEFLNVSSTPEVPVLTGRSSCLKAVRMSPQQGS